MTKRDITTTELVWPGKYNADGMRREVARVNLPFQIIEAVNESRATREGAKEKRNIDVFDVYGGDEGDTFEAGWKNKLIWGDNLLVMSSLLEKFAGKINLIYIDPPFATGTDFSFKTEVGETGEKVSKAQTIIEEKAYNDTWGKNYDSYIAMMYDRLTLMRELLADNGSIYVHCDWRVNSYMRLVLDEVFGNGNFKNWLIWHYYNKYSTASYCLPRAHDDILFYSKGKKITFNEIREKRDTPVQQLVRTNIGGVLRNARDESGNLRYRMSYDKKVDDVWRIPQLQPASSEWTGYATQKHHNLLERIIKASSNKGDLVADFFCGSGTTAAVAEKLGRRWLTTDLGRWAVHTTRKRMLGIENCKPFDVLNLGKYERQYWQGVTFGDDGGKRIAEQAPLYQYLAFIIKLYGAQPLAGMTHLHAKKGDALVHIGAVDAPVTINQVNQAVEECVSLKQKKLHVLGWEWEMGLNGIMPGEAKAKGVKLSLFNIPREVMEQQAADKGDVRFFELAYLDAKITRPEKRAAQVELHNFVMPDADTITEELHGKILRWSDYIDYWAVDWDFQGDTFMQGWVAYRTRRERKLPLVSDAHAYAAAGKYRVLVKVVDIFGNDTSQMLNVAVR